MTNMKLRYIHLYFRKWFIEKTWPIVCRLYGWPEFPFEVASTDYRSGVKVSKIPNPTNCKKLYAKFKHGKRVWVFYDKD